MSLERWRSVATGHTPSPAGLRNRSRTEGLPVRKTINDRGEARNRPASRTVSLKHRSPDHVGFSRIATSKPPGKSSVDVPPCPTHGQRSFCVEGDGIFPTDLLRQEQCWPARRKDALAISATSRLSAHYGYRQVLLVTCNPNTPSSARWRKKGWFVVI
jgi:hypothetical protein